MPQPKLMSRKQVVGYVYELTGVSITPKTVSEWGCVGVKGVLLDHIYVGNRMFVAPEAVRKFFAEVTEARIQKRAQKEAAACASRN